MKQIAIRRGDLIDYNLFMISPGIFAVVAEAGYELGMLFMRVQEYYESQFHQYRGKNFEILEYMNYYRKQNGSELTCTYTEDWGGYNVPSESFEACIRGLDKVTQTQYDFEMEDILHAIRGEQPFGKFYLIGVNSIDSQTYDHEIAHALYYTNDAYRKEMLELVTEEALGKKLLDKMSETLISRGYTGAVVLDEIQAYLSVDPFIFNGIRGVKTAARHFSKAFKKYKPVI